MIDVNFETPKDPDIFPHFISPTDRGRMWKNDPEYRIRMIRYRRIQGWGGKVMGELRQFLVKQGCFYHSYPSGYGGWHEDDAARAAVCAFAEKGFGVRWGSGPYTNAVATLAATNETLLRWATLDAARLKEEMEKNRMDAIKEERQRIADGERRIASAIARGFSGDSVAAFSVESGEKELARLLAGGEAFRTGYDNLPERLAEAEAEVMRLS